MILTDEHLAQMRATVERARTVRQSAVYITPDSLEALLDLLKEHRLQLRKVHRSFCNKFDQGLEMTDHDVQLIRASAELLTRLDR